MRFARMCQIHIDHTGLHTRKAIACIDLQHITHARCAHEHSAAHRCRTARQSRARSACNDRHSSPGQQLHGRGALTRGARQDHKIRHMPHEGETIALVRHACSDLIEHAPGAEDRSQVIR